MRPVYLLRAMLLVAFAWSAWWVWGAWTARTGLVQWLEARRTDGWEAEWSGIKVRGYPTRIDRTITDLTLADTDGGWVWSAPFFQILGLNYIRDHVILVWPETQTLRTATQTIGIRGDEMRASLTFVPGTDREVEDAVLVFKGVSAVSDQGWSSSAEEIRLASRPDADRPGWVDIGLDVSGFQPRSRTVARLSNAGLVAPVVDTLTADMLVRFDAPWDERALDERRPQPQEIEIRNIAAKWGRLELRIAGSLTVDDTGRAEGDVLVKATNWREILELARQSGSVSDTLANLIEPALDMVSGLAGSPKTLDIPVRFSGGRTMLGPVPIGPAPDLRLP